MGLFNIALCKLDENGNIVAKENLSEKWSVELLEEPNKLMGLDMRGEILGLFKKQLIMDIEKSDVVAKLLFSEE